MTVLRERMIEDMQLHGLSEITQQTYVRTVRQLAEHYRKSPDQITEEELWEYFLHLLKIKRVAPSTFRIALCGIKFFYERTLQKRWTTFEMARPPKEKKLPVVLTIEEVRQILGSIRQLRYFVFLSTIYACGLRIREATHLRVEDIDGERKTIHVCNGKGGKDRYVPLPQPILEMLRRYWVSHRHPVWLFRLPMVWEIACAQPRSQSHPGECSEPSSAPCRNAGSRNQLLCTHCVMHTPLICWKPGSASALSRHIWGTPLQPQRPCIPI